MPDPQPLSETDPAIRAIVGLGNPGPRYERTRHNVGFLVIDKLRGAASWQKRPHGEEAEVSLGGRPVRLIRPLTFMNRSGGAIVRLLEEMSASASEILVVTDDVYLPWGRIRIRRTGGPGGHRGLESIVEQLETSAFPRIRVGVDSPPGETALEEFVLEPLEGADWIDFEAIVSRAAHAARVICEEGLGEAMNQFNASPRSESAQG